MNRTIRGPLTAAATLAVTLTLGMGGVAFAGTEQDPLLSVDATQTCGRVTLNGASTSGTYDISVHAGDNAGEKVSPLGNFRVTPDGASKTFTLEEDSFGGDAFVSWATVAGPEQNAWVHGAVAVSTDCGIEQAVETTEEEPPPAGEEKPADEQKPADEEQPGADVDINARVEAAINEIRGFECDTTVGALEASGIFTDAYLRITTDLPLGVTSAQLGAISDVYLDRVAELNYCVGDGVAPPADVVDEATNVADGGSDIDGVTGGPSNSSGGNSQFEFTPSTAPETGLL